jgi:hypothetical protein
MASGRSAYPGSWPSPLGVVCHKLRDVADLKGLQQPIRSDIATMITRQCLCEYD